jgi:tetratricopeptide (TPR) repeat protein
MESAFGFHSGVNEQAVGKFRAFSSPAFICLLLAAVTLAVFWPVVHCDFVNYDDPEYFTANPHVLTGLTPANAVWAFTTGHAGNWHPLTWLSLMLDATLFGKGASGPHLTNLLLHTANTALLFLLLRRMTAATWRSALVATLFALHPLHVESVAWITERKDVLSTFFGLLSLWAYADYARKRPAAGNDTPDGWRGSVDYFLALFFFALGLMSKPMLVTLPFLMLLLDWWPLQRFKVQGFGFSVSSLVLEKIPFFVLSAASCVVTFIVQQSGGAVAALVEVPMNVRLENAFVSIARYLGKIFCPVSLAGPYPLPGHWPVLPALLAFALFAGICGAAVFYRKKFPFAFTGWFWFAGALVPVIGLVQVGNAGMADRYTYLPLIGALIVLVWGAGEAVVKQRLPQLSVAVITLLLLSALAARTRDQIGYWQNSGTLFTHTLAVTENNYAAENNLGTWLSENGQFIGAKEHFQRSLQIRPDNPDALFNLGNALARLGDWDGAVANYQRVLQIAPPKADILVNLGFALAVKKQFAEAVTNFEAALRLDPDSADAHNNLATVLFTEHRFDEAAQHYRKALRLTPDDPRIYANLGDALVRLGQIPDAVRCYQEALRLKPGNAPVEGKLRALGVEIPK